MTIMQKPVYISEHSLLDSIPEPVAVTDSELVVLSVNRAFVELLGYSEDELAGKPITSLSEACTQIAYLIKKGLKVRNFEASLTAKNGRVVPVTLGASFIRQQSAGFDGVLFSARETGARSPSQPIEKDELAKRVEALEYFREGVFLIIQDLEESERELEDAYKKLKATQAQLIQSSKLSALGELAASIVHEINQPLTVVKGLSQSLLKDAGGKQTEKLRLISEACRKMEQVIKHLRIFSRAESFDRQEVDLNAVIKDSFIILKELLSKSSIDVKMELAPLPFVTGSANRLEQVVINLVANAKDAMIGGGTLTIRTEPVEAGGLRFARMSVIDTGCGISEEILGRVFDPFFTTKEPGKGTGLGLSISYGIVKEHNGDITVESEAGKGTAFQVTLPAFNRSPLKINGEYVISMAGLRGPTDGADKTDA